MRVGITLPQFRDDAGTALDVAREAEGAGLAGVFAFDHLWPIGRPDRPALHGMSLLAAVAAFTERVAVGTLVARVSLVPDAVLVHSFATLDHLAPGRVIAGLGAGDRASKAENLAYGVRYGPVAERLASLAHCCDLVRDLGLPTWVGGRSPATAAVAAEHADALNLWAAGPEDLAGQPVEVTWGGQVLIGRTPDEAEEKLARFGPRPGLVHGTVESVARRLDALAQAGATWAVCAPLDVGLDSEAVTLMGEVGRAVGRL